MIIIYIYNYNIYFDLDFATLLKAYKAYTNIYIIYKE